LTEASSDPSAPADVAEPPPRLRHGPGLFRFSIEGRVAPGLFVLGWLATVIGAGVALVGLLGAPSVARAALLVGGLTLLSIGLGLLAGSQTLERRAAGEPYAGPSPVLVFLVTITATLVAGGLLGIVLDAVNFPNGPPGDLVAVLLQAVVFTGVVGVLVVGSGALTWREMGFTADAGRIAGGLATGAIYAAPVVLVTGLFAAFLVQVVGQSPPSPLPPTGSTTGLVLHLLAGAVVAPFAEETLFRGAMLTAWARSTGARSAIIRAAILFAAAHALTVGGTSFGQAAGTAVVAAAGRLPVALALGWIYVRTGTIWAPMGLHAAFNAILIIVSETAGTSVGS
jgi:membrane protease YdiL (CAAX protease family)